MLLGTLVASLLGNHLTGKWALATSHKRVVKKKGKGVIRAGYGHNNNNKMDF